MLPLRGMSGSSAGQPPRVRPDWVQQGTISSDQYLDPGQEALAFTPW